jgi:hypothetical protein
MNANALFVFNLYPDLDLLLETPDGELFLEKDKSFALKYMREKGFEFERLKTVSRPLEVVENISAENQEPKPKK